MTLPAAVAAAIAQRDEWKALGFDQAALDEASRKGFAAGVFEESAEEVEGVLEEFYPIHPDAEGVQPKHSPQNLPLPTSCPRRLPVMAHLEHLFAAGVRFDTEVQYLAKGKRGLRYQKLPVLKSASPLKCAFNSALQCVAIAGQVPIRTLTGEAGRKAQEVLAQGDNQPGESDMLDCIRTLDADVSATLTSFKNPREMGRAALQVLRSGGIALIRYASATGSNWATVIGVESERGSDYARALLLLDCSASESWACAHNVRRRTGYPCGPFPVCGLSI